MATKVEDLRERIIHCLCGGSTTQRRVDYEQTTESKIVDSLIAAARAEGAEAEREKILAESKAMGDTEVDDFPTAYLVPASLLAPAPKEEK